MTGARPAVGRARRLAAQAGAGLVQVLIGPDPAPAWRSPWHRRAVFGGLTAATLVLCLASLVTVSGSWIRVVSNAIQRVPPGRLAKVAGHAVVISTSRPGLFSHPVFLPGGWLLPAGPMTVAALIALVVVVPLPLAARYPLLGWRIGWLALLLVPLTGATWGNSPWDAMQLLVLLVVFCVAGVRHQRPVLWWMWALTLIPWLLWTRNEHSGLLICALGAVAFTALAVLVDAMGSRRRAQRSLAGQAERTELERARRAVLEERARIARELHDVVAHHMSLIAVRAETAPYRLGGLPEQVRDEFGSLSGAAREALADMRRLLGVLRYDQPAARAPQPQLSDLPVLVDAARQAGVPVELSAPPALDQVPASVGVCAYRIVQESLSNASRHAPGAAVTVSVARSGGAVLLRVANGPGGPGPGSGPGAAAGPGVNGHERGGNSYEPGGNSPGPGADGAAAALTPATGLDGLAGNGHGPGQGLTGMRERVALLGGSLSAGPAPGGGYVVSAVLPLGEAA
ncbi:MAG TPA: histidine kinase [Streptosporangiaceae bacterium]|nr:histidine kinase [Streptosporangiaceae bacterium]